MDQQAQEREELEGVVGRLKERLERETAAHMECTERARASACRAHQLEQQVTYMHTLTDKSPNIANKSNNIANEPNINNKLTLPTHI